MSKKNNIITPTLLRSWSPCIEGYRRFCELFPKGTDLETAGIGLMNDGHSAWGEWLYIKCREKKLYEEITSKGFANSGNWNSGDLNSGNWNSGDLNSGNWNSGNRNSGNWNSGDWNSGNRNSGDLNSGNRNSGNLNSGNRNSGNWNSGDWNSGDWNSGFFNSNTPEDILVFEKPCKRTDWSNIIKPNFIFFDLTYWVSESQMTDEEKKADPKFDVRGGQLRKKDYKVAWKQAWDAASKEDRLRLKALPNFDIDIFCKISGLDKQEVNQALNSKPKKSVTLELTDEQISKVQDMIKDSN